METNEIVHETPPQPVVSNVPPPSRWQQRQPEDQYTGSGRISLEGVFKGGAQPLYGDTDLEESGSQLSLEPEQEVEKTCFTAFLTNCTFRDCLWKTAATTIFFGLIGLLAWHLEPGYPEINVYTPKSHALCMRLLNESLSQETMDQISQRYTPQAMALEWMDNDPKLSDYPLWRHQQRFALVTLYYAFNGVLWSDEDRGDWLSYDVSECRWRNHGLDICEDETHRLDHLILSEIQNFWGTMPPEVNFLAPKEISITRMTSQSFAVDDLLHFDKRFVSRLEKINFSHTHLHGSIPTDIGWIPKLQELHLTETHSLEGEIPPQIRLLENLRFLSVQGNKLTGPLPYQLVSLSSLEHIHMQDNQFTGRIPDKWCALTNLQTLHLDDNFLEGAIPQCIPRLPELTEFSYGGNQLIAP